MEIWHRVAFSKNDNIKEYLDSKGISYNRSILPNGNYIITVEIRETDANWLAINPLIRQNTFDFVWTEFSTDEIKKAKWVLIRPDFSIGTPVGNHWDLVENRCNFCGVGWKQIHPICLKKEPNYER